MDLPEDRYQTVEDLDSAVILRIKGSKFIAHVLHVEDTAAAEQRYSAICKTYNDATHNCYAYRIDFQTYRYSDDGEPGGTAGRPILQAIERKKLFKTMVVVTRYFGGTKLGAGGLVHAYGSAAAAGIEKAGRKLVHRLKTLEIVTSYDRYPQIENLIKRFHGSVIASDYKENIRVRIAMPDRNLTEFQKTVLPLIKTEET